MLQTPKTKFVVRIIFIAFVFILLTAWSFVTAQDSASTSTPAPTIIPTNDQTQLISTLQADVNITRARLFIELSQLLQDTNWSLAALLAVEAYKSVPNEIAEHNLLNVTEHLVFNLSRLNSGFKSSLIGINTAVSPDKKTLVVSENDGQIVRWDFQTEKIIYPILGDLGKSVKSLQFSPDGKVFASSTNGYGISIWNTITGQREQLLSVSDNLYPLVFTADSKLLWTVGADRQASLWSLAEQKVLRTVNLSELTQTSAYNPDDDLFVGISDAQKVTLRRTVDLSIVATFEVEKDQMISSVGLSPDQKSVAVALIDAKWTDDFRGVVVWDVPSGKAKLKKIRPPKEHFSAPYSDEMFAPNSLANTVSQIGTHSLPQVSQDAKRLVVFDSEFTVWDITGSEPVKLTEIFERMNNVRTVAFGGNRIAINQDDEIWLWHIKPAPITPTPMNTEEFINYICSKIGRNMTIGEWKHYMGDAPYQKTCDQWPVSTDFILNQVGDKVYTARNQTPRAVPDFSNLIEAALETKNPWVANYICWYGSIYGSAQKVLPLCNAGVQWMPHAADLIDSRGLARALTGDIQGAIADFEFFIAARKSDKQNVYIEAVKRRENWIQALKAGENPFTDAVLKQLQDEASR